MFITITCSEEDHSRGVKRKPLGGEGVKYTVPTGMGTRELHLCTCVLGQDWFVL